jgi:predicted P-loop ATPase/GTPase
MSEAIQGQDEQLTSMEVVQPSSSQLEKIYHQLQASKARRSEITKMCKDEMSHNDRHREIVEEMKELRMEKKAIEQDLRMNALGVEAELDELKTEILSDTELLADIALNMYTSGQNVEIVDEYDNRYVPLFKVSFKRQ